MASNRIINLPRQGSRTNGINHGINCLLPMSSYFLAIFFRQKLQYQFSSSFGAMTMPTQVKWNHSWQRSHMIQSVWSGFLHFGQIHSFAFFFSFNFTTELDNESTFSTLILCPCPGPWCPPEVCRCLEPDLSFFFSLRSSSELMLFPDCFRFFDDDPLSVSSLAAASAEE